MSDENLKRLAEKYLPTVEAFMLGFPNDDLNTDTHCPGLVDGEKEPCSRTDYSGRVFKSCGLDKCIVNQLLEKKGSALKLQKYWPAGSVKCLKDSLDADGKIDLSKVPKAKSQQRVAEVGTNVGQMPNANVQDLLDLMKAQQVRQQELHEQQQQVYERVNRLVASGQDSDETVTQPDSVYWSSGQQNEGDDFFHSGQSDSSLASDMTNTPSSMGSVASRPSYGYQSGQSSGPSGLNHPSRANAAGSVPGLASHSGQKGTIMSSNDQAELNRYRRMIHQSRMRQANSRGRGTYGRGNPGGRGYQP